MRAHCKSAAQTACAGTKIGKARPRRARTTGARRRVRAWIFARQSAVASGIRLEPETANGSRRSDEQPGLLTAPGGSVFGGRGRLTQVMQRLQARPPKG